MSGLSRYNFYLQTISDLLAILAAFFISLWLKFLNPWGSTAYIFRVYQRLLFLIIIIYLIINFLVFSRDTKTSKTVSQELKGSFKTMFTLNVTLIIYNFITKTTADYSRAFILYFVVISFVLDFLFRTIVHRKILPMFKSGKNAEKLIMVGTYEMLTKKVASLKNSDDWRFQLTGLVVVNRKMTGQYIDGIKVISDASGMYMDIQNAEADALLFVAKSMNSSVARWVKIFSGIGMVVHVNIGDFDIVENSNRIIDQIGNCAVISYYPASQMSRKSEVFKRIVDFIVALVLMPFYFAVWFLTAIFTNLESKGPIHISRIRIGKNGRRFYQYRFRILRMDAEERMRKGKSPFTRWGLFLRKTHLDGLPTLLNVLSSDMSLVGTKSLSLQEFLAYDPERRRSLSVKTGLVGVWSCEDEDSEIRKSEREYVSNWSFGKDFLIVLEMIARYITFHSTRKYTDELRDEEIRLIHNYEVFKRPLEYDHSAYVWHKTGKDYVYLFVKRAFDIVASLLGIVILSPLLLILMLLVMADDGGSPFYGHERVGLHGKKIKVYKFRSMRQDAGDLEKLLTPEQLEQYKREFKIDNDPRITKVGNFLRRSSLDELPQLFNILGGSLSIVGPRPIVAKETEIYGKDVAKLLSVKPGLTGYWQAYARNNATYETGERQAMEMYYVDHKGLKLDIKILFKTVSSVIKKEGAQ